MTIFTKCLRISLKKRFVIIRSKYLLSVLLFGNQVIASQIQRVPAQIPCAEQLQRVHDEPPIPPDIGNAVSCELGTLWHSGGFSLKLVQYKS
jgi:hypothetical protein